MHIQHRGPLVTLAPDDGGAPGSPPPSPPPASPPPAPAAWYAGLEPEVIGHLETQGWNALEPPAAVAAAVKAAREAAAFNGVPANELLRLPKDPADPAWKGVWTRLGAAADATGYDLSGVKVGDKPLDPAFASWAQKTAADLNLPVPVAQRLAGEIAKFNADQAATKATDDAAALATAKEKLAANWGPNAEANLFIAKQAAAKLGATPEAVAALEQVLGYDKVMELFLNVGTKIGEDKFVANLNPTIPGVMSRDQAVARKSELMKDGDWARRYLAGDSAAVKEMTALNVLITGESGSTYQPA